MSFATISAQIRICRALSSVVEFMKTSLLSKRFATSNAEAKGRSFRC